MVEIMKRSVTVGYSLEYLFPRACHIEQGKITSKLQKEYDAFKVKFEKLHQEYLDLIDDAPAAWLEWDDNDDWKVAELEPPSILVYDETEEEWHERIKRDSPWR